MNQTMVKIDTDGLQILGLIQTMPVARILTVSIVRLRWSAPRIADVATTAKISVSLYDNGPM